MIPSSARLSQSLNDASATGITWRVDLGTHGNQSRELSPNGLRTILGITSANCPTILNIKRCGQGNLRNSEKRSRYGTGLSGLTV